MKTADIRLNILKIIKDSECYGYEIHQKLAAQNKEIEIGRLYKVLKQMQTESVLECYWERSQKGPEKKMYKIAEKGKKELNEILLDAIETVHAFYGEYLLSLPNKTSIFGAFAKMVSPNAKEHCNIAYYAASPSPMHNRLIAALQSRLQPSEFYVIHPRKVNLNLTINNVISLSGDHDSIPLKERHVDLLVIEDLPNNQDPEKATKEWIRVLKEKGTLAIIAPAVIFSKFKDPLTIGDFMEKIEHQNQHFEEAANSEVIQQLLEKHFRKVLKKDMLQMTILLAES